MMSVSTLTRFDEVTWLAGVMMAMTVMMIVRTMMMAVTKLGQ